MAACPRLVPRLAVALALGLSFALYSHLYWPDPRPQPSDFAQLWFAAQTLLQGENPYDAIGPGRAFHYQFPLLYPLTAPIVAMPFAVMPLRLAEALFVGLGAALLAWAMTRRSLANPQLLVFPSFTMVVAAQTVQWSPWLTAAALMPWIGFLFACKPSIGLAMLVAYPSRRAIVGAGVFALLTVAIWPWWPAEWVAALPAATHMSAPVMRWGGPLLLLALLKWRRPEARLLAALACIPQTPVMYEALPLFLMVQTVKEGAVLMVLTTLVGRIVMVGADGADYQTWMAVNGQWMVCLVYLPCLLMVLRRPNEGLELSWPTWWPKTLRRIQRAGPALQAH